MQTATFRKVDELLPLHEDKPHSRPDLTATRSHPFLPRSRTRGGRAPLSRLHPSESGRFCPEGLIPSSTQSRESPQPACHHLTLSLVTQSCPTLCDPMDCSPPGSSLPGIPPGKNTGVGCHALLQGIFLAQGWNLGFLHCG